MNLAKFNWRIILTIATVSMLFQQAFSYVCQMVMPFLADRIAEDLGISRAWLGLYLFLQNFVSIIAAIGCGGFIVRYGPLRISQLALVMMGTSLVVISTGFLWVYPIAAVLLGASAVSTPASSHILARVCPPKLAPLIFSVKQTGVPVGSLIGGLLIPLLLGLVFYVATIGTTVRLGAYGAAFVTAIIVFSVALCLQPIRAYFDRDRQPDTKLSISDLPETMKLVLHNYPLRDIAFAAFAFGGLQSLFAGFFILFLLDGLDYSETEAGTAFAVASFSAVWARILWGYLGSGFVSPRLILSGIGLFGAVAAVFVAFFDGTWTLYEITAIAMLYNITALSWHGILLAEIARLAPADKVGGVTGGVLSFTSVAMMIYPAMYGIVLAYTGSYRAGFVVGAIPSLIACFVFLRGPVQGSWWTATVKGTRQLASRQTMATIIVVLGVGVALGITSTRIW
ncbi:MAG: MFS transporter [Gammaproteobacteria bacterium]|nr:MFS transporter [Gammaproteobacteria bacterium]